MFYWKYLNAELWRRLSKTITISVGLAVASAIIIVIISISNGLSSAEQRVLNPLQNVGTDMIVSRSVSASQIQSLDPATRQELLSQNSIGTDLSKLGSPGSTFSRDVFLPGTMLTFDSSVEGKVNQKYVSETAGGLIMTVDHQSGTVPKVTATFQTQSQTYNVQQNISPLTDAEQQALDAARSAAMKQIQQEGLDPNSQQARDILRQAQQNAMPARFKQFIGSVTVPGQTYQENVGPISTDINTSTFTVAGVDTSKTNMGLILPNQITDGKYFNAPGQIILNQSFAEKNNLTVGKTYTLGGKTWKIVGLVNPTLYTDTADMYLPLSDLQNIAGKQGQINLMLVKATNAKLVDQTSKSLSALFTGATITDSSSTADQVSGSLVDAASLTSKFIGVASIIVIIASFIIVSLLTLLSVNKRVREIGTLKAIGWSNSTIMRQIFLENLFLGIIGAAIGVGMGVVGIIAFNHYNFSLSASIANGSNLGASIAKRFLGGGNSSNSINASIPLKVTYDWYLLCLGAGVSVIGSILAGGVAAFKSSHMRAQEALRNIE